MKLQTLLVSIATVLTMLSGCLEVGQSLDSPAPSWKSGYVYSFTDGGRYSIKSSGSGPDGGGSRNQEETREPRHVVYEVLNTTFKSAAGEPAYLVAFTRGDEKPELPPEAGPEAQAAVQESARVVLAAVRQRDLHDMPVSWSLDQNCVNRVCRIVLERVGIGAGPTWTFLDFPLKAGKKWTASMSEGVSDVDGLRLRMDAEVDGRAKAKTQLGSLTTVRVSFDWQPENLDEVKQNIRREAEAEGVEVRELELRVRMQATIFYSPVYQNVVRIERTYDQAFKVSGRENGDDFSFAFENHVEFWRELNGARLIGYPERDLSGIGRVLVGETPLADPHGQAFKPVGYTVQLEADKHSLNVAAQENATFKAVLKGVQELPSGHSLTWSIVDPFGKSTPQEAGTTLDFQPAAPGLYLVQVEARDAQGNTTSAAVQPLAANYVTTKRASCNQFHGPLVSGTCQPMMLPVRPGVESLKVVARVGGMLSQLGSGELRLTDAAQHVTRDTTRSGNEYSIQLGRENAFNLRGVSDKEWTLVYAPSRSVLESVDYSVELLFGGPSLEPETLKRTSAGFPTVRQTLPGQDSVSGFAADVN